MEYVTKEVESTLSIGNEYADAYMIRHRACGAAFRVFVPRSLRGRFEIECTCGKTLSTHRNVPSLGIVGTDAKIVNWTDRGDGGHKCGAKCRNAQGPNCECECHGTNHGAGNNATFFSGN